jgi:hypothetical protein
MDVVDDRPLDLDRVVLLRLRTEVEQVVGRVVDTADEGLAPVDYDDLAVHAAEQVGAQPAE